MLYMLNFMQDLDTSFHGPQYHYCAEVTHTKGGSRVNLATLYRHFFFLATYCSSNIYIYSTCLLHFFYISHGDLKISKYSKKLGEKMCTL